MESDQMELTMQCGSRSIVQARLPGYWRLDCLLGTDTCCPSTLATRVTFEYQMRVVPYVGVSSKVYVGLFLVFELRT
ncbi:uncharacterized protein ARMOST_20398 [Armillaria ostoyae]|uniref:Uncharacterized protein n=1 Tax=Armillaria ostoyae TaxID=47428 RepID=A0A284S781_ARMOS|nr:uncharacterized protein ARMOST_20398 [Armillaria ostoyae]